MDPYVGEIRPVAFSFAPKGWALCNGQIMPISQNTALFSLLGTMYGGDGKSTFALPNLGGQVPIHHGQGPGLSDRIQGETSGSLDVTLILTEIPAHTHGQVGGAPTTNVPAAGTAFADGGAYGVPASAAALPHSNVPPYLVVNYIIALQGVFPSRG